MSGAREIPIPFKGPMVRALLDGRKTQARWIMKPQPRVGRYGATHPTKPSGIIGPVSGGLGGGDYHVWEGRHATACLTESGVYVAERQCPYGAPGDTMWVRETWAKVPMVEIFTGARSFQTVYRAGRLMGIPPEDRDYLNEAKWRKEWRDDIQPDRWRPSIHMPRALSRIALRVTDVRVERLNDISDADAAAEGAPRGGFDEDGRFYENPVGPDRGTHTAGFAGIWEHINGPDSWAANPWVWAISFDMAA